MLTDKIEILDDGHIQIRRVINVIENEIVISKTYHRSVLFPGQDISDQEEEIQEIANNIWTQEVIDAYQEKVASQNI